MKTEEEQKIDDGGPAYPGSGVYGMSLRDAFAKAALEGMLAAGAFRDSEDATRLAAVIAYDFADAMLRERKE